MSEQAEHTLKETDPQMKADKLGKEQTKSEEITMSVNAFNSLRNEKSIVHSKEQSDLQPPEDECNQSSCSSYDGTGIIYYVSSEDESTHSYNDEDDDRYMDNEDMDEADLVHRYKRRVMEDEDVDDEEHCLRLRVHSNDDTDTEYEQDCFARASDDFALGNRLKYRHKERSLSLQDLSNYKYNARTQYNKRRQSFILKRKYLNLKPNLVAYSNIRTIPLKYRHMQNRRTRITKEQDKNSKSKNMKDPESTMNESHERNEDNDVEEVNATNETAKDNIKTAINEPQTDEIQTTNLVYNTVQIMESDENHELSERIIENGYMNTEDVQYNHVQNGKYMENSDDKLGNVNESMDVSMQMECNDAEMVEAQEMDNSDTSCCLKITNVKSIRATPDESENFSFTKNNAVDRLNADITELKTQFRQFHQKTLTDTIKIQQELDGLKKSLSKYEDENQMSETKDVTEDGTVIEPTSKQDIVTSKQLNNQNEIIMESGETSKMSTGSIEPGISYTNETAETADNPAKSINSSNLTSLLNTEDNTTHTTSSTSKKLAEPSPTFITSTRILQTLSNIIQGKVESYLPNNTKERLDEDSIRSQNQKSDSPIVTSSKKRKAQVLDSPTFVQNCKIPNTNTEFQSNTVINGADIKLEYSVEQDVDKTLTDKTIDDSTRTQIKMEYPNNYEDSVKYFVYKNANNARNGSFLIEAEEPIKNLENEEHRIRECGPYILGDLEVRMSEINGKINIWGREINHESESGNDDELEASERPSQRTSRWQDTSQSRFNSSSFVCSTNKKKKIPSRLNKSNISQCCNLHCSSINAQLSEDVNDKRCANSCKRMSCENCNSSKCDNAWPRCNTSSLRERIHSCCMHHDHIQTTNKACNCECCRKKQALDISCKCCRDKSRSVGIQQHSCEDAHVSNSKSCSDCVNQIASDTSSKNRYEVPQKRPTETTEMKKQKLSGERVRGILMDFLRAHEGDRDITAGGSNENRFQQKESSQRLNDSQQMKSSTSTQDEDRCCHACESRLTTQLGKLEMRMERVQSRLDAIVDMLNKLLPMDIN